MDRLERITEPDGYRRVAIEVASTDGAQPLALSAFAYLKEAAHVIASDLRLGPLHAYTLEHAALYRRRA